MPAWRTTVVDTTGEPCGRIPVTVVDGREEGTGRTFVVALGFRACAESFEMQRFQVIAHRLQARLVVVDTPGFGYAGARLTPSERKALRAGNFTVLAARMLSACRKIADLSGAGAIGYSLGSSTVAAMASIADLDPVVLVEPVAYRRWNPLSLASAMSNDDRHVEIYLRQTALVLGAVEPFDRRAQPLPGLHHTDLLALVLGMCRGHLTADLTTAARRALRRLLVVQGDLSSLSSRAGGEELAATLTETHVSTDLWTVPGHHGVWHSLPAVADLADRLATALAGQE